MEFLFKFIGFIVTGVLLLFFIFAGFSLFGQNIEKNQWGQFEYVVHADNRYYYTHQVVATKDNRCIQFVDNYNKQTELCEKYQVEENYWHTQSPNIKTVIWSP